MYSLLSGKELANWRRKVKNMENFMLLKYEVLLLVVSLIVVVVRGRTENTITKPTSSKGQGHTRKLQLKFELNLLQSHCVLVSE